MKKREHVLMVLLAVALATLLVAQLTTPYRLRARFKDQPGLNLLPKALPLEAPAQCKTNLCVDGYSIGVPWGNCTSVHSFASNPKVGGGAYAFDNGRRFIVFINSKEDQPISFDSSRKIRAASPRDFRPFESRDKIGKTVGLLKLKSVLGTFPYSAVYEFETPRFRGFQMGNPEVDTRVEIEAFGRDGGLLYFVVPVGKEGENPLTQAQLNCMIQSLEANSR